MPPLNQEITVVSQFQVLGEINGISSIRKCWMQTTPKCGLPPQRGIGGSGTLPRFGSGTAKIDDFRIDLTWKDVDNLIREFAAMKEPSAIALQQAKFLAAAAQQGGWYPTSS
jgi:hypothetical protein